ncbi:hypothetical protein V3C99_017103, partial [Haemonchus contortus]
FDEFGFRKRDDAQISDIVENGIEDSGHRMRFLAAIEFVHSNMKGELTWSKLNTDLLYTEKIEDLVKAGG